MCKRTPFTPKPDRIGHTCKNSGHRFRLPDYARITAPSLVIGFADDQLAPTLFGREVAAAIPGARYVEIERCGHYGYLERPEEVNRIVIEFLTAA